MITCSCFWVKGAPDVLSFCYWITNTQGWPVMSKIEVLLDDSKRFSCFIFITTVGSVSQTVFYTNGDIPHNSTAVTWGRRYETGNRGMPSTFDKPVLSLALEVCLTASLIQEASRPMIVFYYDRMDILCLSYAITARPKCCFRKVWIIAERSVNLTYIGHE